VVSQMAYDTACMTPNSLQNTIFHQMLQLGKNDRVVTEATSMKCDILVTPVWFLNGRFTSPFDASDSEITDK